MSVYQLTKMVAGRRLISMDAADEMINKLSKVLDLAVSDEQSQVLEDPIIVAHRVGSAQLLSQKMGKKPLPTESDDNMHIGGDLDDTEMFFQCLKKEIEKRFSKTSFVANVLDNKFQTRLSAFIKETQSRFPSSEDLTNLTKRDDDFVLDNLLKIEPETLITMIRTRANKILIIDHEIKLLRVHIRQRTVPLALLSQNFPYPLLNEDIKFTADYDKLIGKLQVEIMELLIHYLDTDCKQSLENEINELSLALRQVMRISVDEVSERLDEIYETEMRMLARKFEKGLDRASRIKRISFTSLLQKKLKKKKPVKIKIPVVEKDEIEIDGLLMSNTELNRSSKLKNYKPVKSNTVINTKPNMRRAKTNVQITPATSLKRTTTRPTKSVNTNRQIIYDQRPTSKQGSIRSNSKLTGARIVINSKAKKSDKTSKNGEYQRTSPIEFISDKSENYRKNSLVESRNIMVPENELDCDSQVVINSLIKKVVSNNKLINPFAAKKKTLPQLKKPYSSLESMKDQEYNSEAEIIVEPPGVVIKSNLVSLNEPFNFSHSTEYKEIVSKVMTLKNFAKNNRPKVPKGSETYNNLLFNNDHNKSSSNVMKIVINEKRNKEQNRSMISLQEIQPIRVPTQVPLSHKSLVPDESNSPRHSLVPQNTIIHTSTEPTFSQDGGSFYSSKPGSELRENSMNDNNSHLHENRRIVRVCVQ